MGLMNCVRWDLYFHFLLFVETGKIDQEIHKYNTPGFTGCLSRVQFNHIAPLKAALRPTNASALVHIQGELVESNCGASPLTLSPMSSATDPWHLDHLDSGKVWVFFSSFLNRIDFTENVIGCLTGKGANELSPDP